MGFDYLLTTRAHTVLYEYGTSTRTVLGGRKTSLSKSLGPARGEPCGTGTVANVKHRFDIYINFLAAVSDQWFEKMERVDHVDERTSVGAAAVI